MRRQSLSLPNMFSILWRALQSCLLKACCDLPVALWQDAGLDVPGSQCFAELIAVVALVGDQRVRQRQPWIE